MYQSMLDAARQEFADEEKAYRKKKCEKKGNAKAAEKLAYQDELADASGSDEDDWEDVKSSDSDEEMEQGGSPQPNSTTADHPEELEAKMKRLGLEKLQNCTGARIIENRSKGRMTEIFHKYNTPIDKPVPSDDEIDMSIGAEVHPREENGTRYRWVVDDKHGTHTLKKKKGEKTFEELSVEEYPGYTARLQQASDSDFIELPKEELKARDSERLAWEATSANEVYARRDRLNGGRGVRIQGPNIAQSTDEVLFEYNAKTPMFMQHTDEHFMANVEEPRKRRAMMKKRLVEQGMGPEELAIHDCDTDVELEAARKARKEHVATRKAERASNKAASKTA